MTSVRDVYYVLHPDVEDLSEKISASSSKSLFSDMKGGMNDEIYRKYGKEERECGVRLFVNVLQGMYARNLEEIDADIKAFRTIKVPASKKELKMTK